MAPAHAGDVIRYEKHNKTKGNTKIKTFVATSFTVSGSQDEQRIHYGNDKQSSKAKFCRPLEAGCLHTVDYVTLDEYLKIIEKRKKKNKKSKTKQQEKESA